MLASLTRIGLLLLLTIIGGSQDAGAVTLHACASRKRKRWNNGNIRRAKRQKTGTKTVVRAYTSKAEYADTSDPVVISYLVGDEWTDEVNFLRASAKGQRHEKKIYLREAPTKMRLKTTGTNAWGFWKISVNHVPILKDPNGPGGRDFETSEEWEKYWIDGDEERNHEAMQEFDIPSRCFNKQERLGDGKGRLLDGYHGDPERRHRFWVYPKGKKLRNKEWDTYDPKTFCRNRRFVKRNCWTCLGHGVEPEESQDEDSSDSSSDAEKSDGDSDNEDGKGQLAESGFHGDEKRGHCFWVYPKGKKLKNPQWDCHNPQKFCHNSGFVKRNQWRCYGHGENAREDSSDSDSSSSESSSDEDAAGSWSIKYMGKGQLQDRRGRYYDSWYSSGHKTAFDAKRLLAYFATHPDERVRNNVVGVQLHEDWSAHIRVNNGFALKEIVGDLSEIPDSEGKTEWGNGSWTKGTGRGEPFRTDVNNKKPSVSPWQSWKIVRARRVTSSSEES